MATVRASREAAWERSRAAGARSAYERACPVEPRAHRRRTAPRRPTWVGGAWPAPSLQAPCVGVARRGRVTRRVRTAWVGTIWTARGERRASGRPSRAQPACARQARMEWSSTMQRAEAPCSPASSCSRIDSSTPSATPSWDSDREGSERSEQESGARRPRAEQVPERVQAGFRPLSAEGRPPEAAGA